MDFADGFWTSALCRTHGALAAGRFMLPTCDYVSGSRSASNPGREDLGNRDEKSVACGRNGDGARLVGATAAHAGMLSFDFSFSNDGAFVDGSTDGTVTGEVTGLTNNATSSATHVYILSYPAGLGSIPGVPFDALSLADVESNSFTVSNGSVRGGDFFAQQYSRSSAAADIYWRSEPSLRDPLSVVAGRL